MKLTSRLLAPLGRGSGPKVLAGSGVDPHVASQAEDWVNARVTGFLTWRGWVTRCLGYPGYGDESFVRVFGRVVFTRPDEDGGDQEPVDAVGHSEHPKEEFIEDAMSHQRGWRIFVTAPAPRHPVEVTIGDRTISTRTDRSGYIDIEIRDHGLKPGLHQVTISTRDGEPATAPIHIIWPDTTHGLISDIDDTVIVTHLPRILIAGWNTFVKSQAARDVVPGMAELYRKLREEHSRMPVFYLSTGAWNAAPLLLRFLKRHGYPAGPLLMTDWGPTRTGWFRSGAAHKRRSLQRLRREFPRIKWTLVGDDGQHDPELYSEFAAQHQGAVELIAIRELSPAEQMLSHGIPLSNEELSGRRARVHRAPDGYTLWAVIKRRSERRNERP